MNDLRIGVLPSGLDAAAMDFVRNAEQLGVDSVWAPEAWMYDALTPLGYIAAITQRVRLATGVVQRAGRDRELVGVVGRRGARAAGRHAAAGRLAARLDDEHHELGRL